MILNLFNGCINCKSNVRSNCGKNVKFNGCLFNVCIHFVFKNENVEEIFMKDVRGGIFSLFKFALG
jgi:hypothetical protein